MPIMDKYEKQVAAWERRRRIMLDLLREKWTLERIGRKYGITKQAVWRVVNRKPRQVRAP